MELLHLTHKKNLKSILTHGIVPSYIDLPNHWDAFNKLGLGERKCVYMWNGETYNNTKFIKDMIYTKMYIHPRNKLYTDDPDGESIDFRKFGDKLYGDSATYYLLRIHDYDDPFMYNYWAHTQEPDDTVRDSTTTIMDDKYAHDDKTNKLGLSFSKNK